MSELKVAVMTGTGHNMMAAGGMNPGVRQTGFIAANSIMPQPSPTFPDDNPPIWSIIYDGQLAALIFCI